MVARTKKKNVFCFLFFPLHPVISAPLTDWQNESCIYVCGAVFPQKMLQTLVTGKLKILGSPAVIQILFFLYFLKAEYKSL